MKADLWIRFKRWRCGLTGHFWNWRKPGTGCIWCEETWDNPKNPYLGKMEEL